MPGCVTPLSMTAQFVFIQNYRMNLFNQLSKCIVISYVFEKQIQLFFRHFHGMFSTFIFSIKSILYLSRLMGKPTICIGENKDADQLRGNREADQHLCFHYSDSTIPLLLKTEISSF